MQREFPSEFLLSGHQVDRHTQKNDILFLINNSNHYSTCTWYRQVTGHDVSSPDTWLGISNPQQHGLTRHFLASPSATDPFPYPLMFLPQQKAKLFLNIPLSLQTLFYKTSVHLYLLAACETHLPSFLKKPHSHGNYSLIPLVFLENIAHLCGDPLIICPYQGTGHGERAWTVSSLLRFLDDPKQTLNK